MGTIHQLRRLGLAILLTVLSACSHNVFSGEPYVVFGAPTADQSASVSSSSMLLNADQLRTVGADFDRFVRNPTEPKPARNNAITEMMFLIDQAYYDYETHLTHDEQAIGAFGSLATLASTTVSGLIPQGAASRVLSGVTTGINGGVTIYDEKILLSQTTHALLKEMRADRDTQAATIFGRMNCAYANDPIGRVRVDLENYARQGTLASAVIALSGTTANKATVAAATKDAASANGGKRGGTGAVLAKQLMATAVQLTTNGSRPLTK